MCKWKMLAGNGYKRFGSTVDEAVCEIIKRYSRMYGCLDDTRVKALIYFIWQDNYKFYEKIEEDRVSEFRLTKDGQKYKTYNGARGKAFQLGVLDGVRKLEDENQINEDEILDAWVSGTQEVNDTYRCSGRWYEDGVTHDVDGYYCSISPPSDIDYDTCYSWKCHDIYYPSEGVSATSGYVFARQIELTRRYDLVESCYVCGGSLSGVLGHGRCECYDLQGMTGRVWLRGRVRKLLSKSGTDINSVAPETIRSIAKVVMLKYSAEKFKRNQPKKNTRKAK